MTIRFFSQRRFRSTGFTLVEIMIVVLLIGILLAIAVPNFVYAREQTRRKACIGNLRKIQWAKDSWLMDNRLEPSSIATPADLWPAAATGYLRVPPQCPSSGVYDIKSGLEDPTCTMGATTGHLVNGS